jgi:hypothetical protein
MTRGHVRRTISQQRGHGPISNAQLLLRADNGELQSLKIDHLLSAMAPQARYLYVGQQIFSLNILTSVIFPALHAARELTFSATDTAVTRQRTGS